MTYTPQYLSNLVPPIPTKSASQSAWQRAIGNHDEMFRDYRPTVAQWAGKPLFTTGSGAEDLFRFRSRNGADFIVSGDGMQLVVQFMARRNNGAALPVSVNVKGGIFMVSVNVTATTWTAYTLTADPATTDEEWTVSAVASAGDYLEVASLVAYWTAGTPGSRQFPSGYRRLVPFNVKDNGPISTELAARLLNGPVTVAKDRPFCVFSHLWKASSDSSGFAKTGDVDYSAWGAQETGETVVVGMGRIPCSDIRPRPFLVTYYFRSSASSTGSIRIGAAVYPVTANGWQSFQVELGPVDVDIIATVDAQSPGEWAYFESVQVWREAT